MAEVVLLAQRSWPETRELLATNEIVLLPIGAHEQHGPGIAMATDTISADGLCRRAAARLGLRAAVAPAVPYGVSWHHMHFPGTITLSSRTLTTVLTEIAAALSQHGFPRVAFVNGHGGNGPALAAAVEESRHLRPVTQVLGLYGYAFIAEGARGLLPADAPGHGGGDEAAVVLAEAPAFAKPDAFGPPETVAARAALTARLRAYGGVSATPYDELTRNGATGDTSAATAEIGEQILDRAAAALAETLEAFIAATPR